MVEHFTLSNGLRVIMERLPHLRSASIGVWVKAGSILERPEENGLSHLMEHMAFKRTAHRSARQLAEEMDAIGGYVNAATSKLSTSYYAKVTDRDLAKAVELLADVTCHPLIDAGDLEKEKQVVLEEIAMLEDSPEDMVHELMDAALFSGHSLAKSIIGTRELISAYTRDELLHFREKYYSPRNTVISVAGGVRRQELEGLLESHFGTWQGGDAAVYPAQDVNRPAQRLARDKKTEQAHVCLGFTGIAQGHRDRQAMKLLATVLGGGASSRLFQRVREEQGLAYSVYASHTAYPDCGELRIYAAGAPRNADKLMAEIRQECERLQEEGVSDQELAQAKAQLRTGLVLAAESAYVRMGVLASNLLVLGTVEPLSRSLRGIETVTRERLLRLARRTLRGPMSLAIVGPRASRHTA